MSKKHNKVCTTLNYIEHFLILPSTITGCVSISTFASLVGVPIGVTTSGIGLKICAITAGIKKYKPIIKKKKNKLVLLAKSQLNIIEVLISKALIDSVIRFDSLIEINNNITGTNNITLRKVNVKPYGFDEMYIDRKLIEDKLYQIIDRFNRRKITSKIIYSILLNIIHPFYHGNGETCKILFANVDIIMQNI